MELDFLVCVNCDLMKGMISDIALVDKVGWSLSSEIKYSNGMKWIHHMVGTLARCKSNPFPFYTFLSWHLVYFVLLWMHPFVLYSNLNSFSICMSRNQLIDLYHAYRIR